MCFSTGNNEEGVSMDSSWGACSRNHPDYKVRFFMLVQMSPVDSA